jgi:HEAT repeat protein
MPHRILGTALALAAALAAGCGQGDLGSPDAAVRAAAVRSLPPGGERALAALLVAQRDASPAVRAAAAERFAARSDPAAADALGKLLLDPDSEVAAAAAQGLAGMPRDPRARLHLVAGYGGASPAGRAAIASALERVGVSLREAVEAEARSMWERNVAALESRDLRARAGAAEELGASGRADALQRLVPLVDPGHGDVVDPAVAAGAARGLGESGEWTARPHLEALLGGETHAALAEVAAHALGRLGDPRASDALAAAGGAEAGRIATATVDALAALPEAPEVGVALCDVAIRATDPRIAARATREARRRDGECPERPLLAKLARSGAASALAALGELGLKGAAAQSVADKVAPLLAKAPEAAVRAEAARALARLGGPTAVRAVRDRMAVVLARVAERRERWVKAPPAPGAPPPFIDPIGPEEAEEAGALLAAAGALLQPEVEPILRDLARDPRVELRSGALDGLGSVATPAALSALTAALGDPALRARVAAAGALGRAGVRGAAPLIEAAKAAEPAAPEWRSTLARALGDTGAAEAIPALAALLDGSSAAAAATALSRIGAPAAAAPLVEYLGRPEAPARADAVEALAQLAARDAAPAIAALLTDDRPEVRAAAARALGKLRHEQASSRLEALRSDYYGRVRRAAVEALAKLPSGMPRARR